MNRLTRCPQCALLFQVPVDPMAHASGRVCCGRCAHEFQAEALVIDVPWHGSTLSAESSSSSPRIDLEALLHRQDVSAEPWSSANHSSSPVPELVPKPDPAPAAIPPRAPTLPAKPDWRIESAAVGAARRAVWVLRGCALLLALGLCWQSLVFFKDEMAAQWPASRMALAALCQPVACTLAPLRRLSGIVIDSASLVRGDAGYVLNVSLRNSVDVPLAMTALELSLTDDQDRVLMRRVLTPADLGAPDLLAAGQTWSKILGVEPGAVQPEIAGYRLVSFYP